MDQLRIFVSHSSHNRELCEALSLALREAGADVWYDQQDLGSGHLLEIIPREIKQRKVFIVILSKSSIASAWVRDECKWAYALYSRESGRTILPIVAETLEQSDLDVMLFLEGFRRIEGDQHRPLPRQRTIQETLLALGLDNQQLGVRPSDLVWITAEEAGFAYPKDLLADKLESDAERLLEYHRYGDALLLLEQAHKMRTDDIQTLEALARAYNGVGRNADALMAYEQVLAEEPFSIRAWKGKAQALRDMGDLENARAAYENALGANRDDWNTWGELAEVLDWIGRFDDAVRAYDEALILLDTETIYEPVYYESWACGYLDQQVHALRSASREFEALEAEKCSAELGRLIGQRQAEELGIDLYEDRPQEAPDSDVFRTYLARLPQIRQSGQKTLG